MSEAPSSDDVEANALSVIWAVLRRDLQPELGSALAKDRAKRMDLALTRLVAGRTILPTVRAAHAEAYRNLLQRARSLSAREGLAPAFAVHGLSDGINHPVFVGVPEVAGELEACLQALAVAAGAGSEFGAEVDVLVADVNKVELTCRLDYESRVAALAPPGAAAADRVLTVESLQTYLRAHERGGPDVVVHSVKEVPGGRSKRTVLVELGESSALPSAIVLRLDTGRGVGTSVVDEYPLLSRVAALGLPVPEPLWLEAAGGPAGFPFIVFRRMPGSAAGDLIEGAFRKEPRTALALARVLGQVHGGGAQLLPADERRSSVAYTRQLLTYYRDYWNSKKPFPSLAIESAFAWLFRGLDNGLGEASVVQADTGFHNLLLAETGEACLLDWEFAHFGDPAEDLASCRPAVERCMSWSEFLAEYQRNGGGPVSAFRLQYFDVWRPLRNAVVCGTVLHSLMQQAPQDIDPVTIALSTFLRLQAEVARSLDAVIDL